MCTEKTEIVAKVGPIFENFKVNKGKGMIFCMDYFSYKGKYIVPFDEFDVCNLLIGYIREQVGIDVKVIESDLGDPLLPIIKFN